MDLKLSFQIAMRSLSRWADSKGSHHHSGTRFESADLIIEAYTLTYNFQTVEIKLAFPTQPFISPEHPMLIETLP